MDCFAYQFFRAENFVKCILFLKIECIKIQFCEAEGLTDVVVNFLGDVFEGLFLDFELSTQKFFLEMLLHILFLLFIFHLPLFICNNKKYYTSSQKED